MNSNYIYMPFSDLKVHFFADAKHFYALDNYETGLVAFPGQSVVDLAVLLRCAAELVTSTREHCMLSYIQ